MVSKKIKEIKDVSAENRRLREVLPLLLWLLLIALLYHIIGMQGTAFIVWIGVLILIYIIGMFLMMCYITTGTVNFFKFFMEKKPVPVVKPKVNFDVYKLLDEYKLDFKTVHGNEYFDTTKAGVQKLVRCLNTRDSRFITIPELVDWTDNKHDKIINIDNITIIDSIQQSETQHGTWGASPKDAKKEITEYLAKGYVLKKLEAGNDEAKSAVKTLKKQFKFKEDD